ncbi:MAG: hypothetical protein GXP62_20495 [Oligoflexia bacterium]|nr:hypothetical protein [Oligoflexia bacterium]
MAIAFAKFDEPHAWLIRGLVEYGWADLTPVAGRIPTGRMGGMELARFRDSDGRDGVHLLVTAQANGTVVAEDAVYDFAVRCYRQDGQWMVGVRCPDANFMAEFPFDAANPSYAAGYIHQAVTTYVPQFVGWRLQGGELSWAQRQGLPELDGEACSADLTRFIDELVRMRRGVDTGPAQGWWIGLDSPPPPASQVAPGATGGNASPGGTPIATVGGPIAVAGRVVGAGVSSTERAMKRAGPAGRALVATSSMMLIIGVVSLLNAALTLVLFQFDRGAALVGTGCFGVALLGGGIVGILGGRRLSQVKNSVLPWLAVGANLALPPLLLLALLRIDVACCSAVGPLALSIPVALYALSVWVDPIVVKARKELGDV